MTTWIAEEPVVWVFPSGEKSEGRIALAAPVPAPSPDIEGDTTWKCEALLEGLWHRPLEVRGDGSMQPLLLMLRLLGYELHAFISRGGRLVMPDEGEGEGEGWHPFLMSFRQHLRRPGDPYPADPVLADLDAEDRALAASLDAEDR
jgi:hypothetical protein